MWTSAIGFVCGSRGRTPNAVSSTSSANRKLILDSAYSPLTIVVDNEYYRDMAGKLQQKIQQRKPIRLLEEEASLNIVRTADLLAQRLSEVLKPYNLSDTQY